MNSLSPTATNARASKKRKTVEVSDFSPELQVSLDNLKMYIANEDWSNKGKFPQDLKPVLASTAMHAVRTGEYGDKFFNLMPTLFPYNRFTMMKLVKRTIFAEHVQLLYSRQDGLLAELKVLAEEGLPKAQEDYERACVLWGKLSFSRPFSRAVLIVLASEKRLERKNTVNESTPGLEGSNFEGATNVSGSRANSPSLTGIHGGSDDEMNGMPLTQSQAPHGANMKDPPPPTRRFRLTDAMKIIVWRLVTLSNEACALENDKNQLEGSTLQVSEQGVRKVLYQKIVGCFPDGWMTSGQLSREVSLMKKRIEKEKEELERGAMEMDEV
jgi:hypothetical protein